MEGGMHGAYDESGAVVEAGWAACGFEQTVDASPEQTWVALQQA